MTVNERTLLHRLRGQSFPVKSWDLWASARRLCEYGFAEITSKQKLRITLKGIIALETAPLHNRSCRSHAVDRLGV